MFESMPTNGEENEGDKNKEPSLKERVQKSLKKAVALGAVATMGHFGNIEGSESTETFPIQQGDKNKTEQTDNRIDVSGEIELSQINKDTFNKIRESDHLEKNQDRIKKMFLKEKKLVVHGIIETPDGRRGGIVPSSEHEINGMNVHEEVRRVFGYEGKFNNTDRIDVYICDENGQAIGMGDSAMKGSARYSKYLPFANQFAKELDEQMYRDIPHIFETVLEEGELEREIIYPKPALSLHKENPEKN